MTLLVAHPAGRAEEWRYASHVVLDEFLGLDHVVQEQPRTDVEITSGGDGRRLVLPGRLLATPEHAWLKRESLPETPLRALDCDEPGLRARIGATSLPVLYGAADEALVRESENELAVAVDVFGSVFFLLTRYEELVVPDRDERDRFPSSSSVVVQARLAERALANEYTELLWWSLARLWPRLERRRRRFGIRPTHDVDWHRLTATTLRRTARSTVGDLVSRRDPALAVDRLASFARARRNRDADLANTFDFLMAESEHRGLRSAFYFIPERTVPQDGDCTLEDPWLRRLLRRIHDRGHEIGFHPSYETFRDLELTRRQYERLRTVCDEERIDQPEWGGRQHFLRWENPTTWHNWEETGLDYDSTVGFADRPGFRCGTCYEFPVFDLKARRQLRLRERPLIVMESTLFDAARLRSGDALGRLRALTETCRHFDGDFILLWHNSQLLSRRQRRWYQLSIEANLTPK
ncbi:MAG: polysaccharide deacetylase family protein [Actinomycetota bacterium]|nr:polysaccharide deacetylase family protein [Actinomycetota bacterium]